MRTAKTEEDAWKLHQENVPKRFGWIQWKGTDVCMDVHCDCGEHFHIDGDFAYNVQCPECGTFYNCNGHIELIKLEQEPDRYITGEKDRY